MPIMSPFRPARSVFFAVLPLLTIVACADPKPASADLPDAAETPESAPELPDAGKPAPSDAAAAGKRSSGPATTAEIMDLMDSRVIHWAVVGDYAGEDVILNVSTSAYAQVTDHVEISFDYTSEGNGGLTGTPIVKNFPGTMGALRNGTDGCRTPTASGLYDHSTIEVLEDGYGGQLNMVVRTDFPAGQVAVFCTGGDAFSPARSSTTETDFIVPSVAMLMMGDQLTGDDLRVSPDKRSFIVKRYGWTYTYTPTKVR